MSVRTCYGPVRAAVGNAFSDAEIDEIVARVTERMQGRADRAAMRDALAVETRESLRDALIAARMEASAKVARDWRNGVFAAMPDMARGKAFDAADKLRAYDTGSDRLGANTGYSTEAEARARFLVESQQVEDGMEASGGKALLDPLFNRAAREAHERDVVIEMARDNGADLPATGNEIAEKQARVFNEALERVRVAQNNEGAWIDKRAGYVAKQNHDRLKVAGGFWNFGKDGDLRAFRAWHDFIRPLLHEATFEGLSEHEFMRNGKVDRAFLDRHGGDLRAAFLERIWQSIVRGGKTGLPGVDHEMEFVAPASKARAVSRGRTLHFTDPEAWLAYHRQYGQGSLYQVIVNQIESGTRNAALMRRWGPNPEAARRAHIERTIGDLSSAAGAASIHTQERLKAALDGKGQIANEWDVLTGAASQVADIRIATIGNAIRIDQRLSKLGGAVWSSLGPDQAIAAQVFRQHGGSYLNGYAGAFGGILNLNAEAQKEAGALLGIGTRAAMAELAGRFDAGDGVAGVGARLTQFMFKATGFEYIMNAHRRGLADMWSAWAASQGHLHFGELPQDFQRELGRFGIGGAQWDAMRAHISEIDGRAYMDFRNLSPDLRLRAQAYVAQFLDDSLTEPGVREQAKLTFGTARGTYLGEAVRCFTQFKAFPLTYITRHLNPAIEALLAGENGAGGKMAHLILSATLFGFLSMQAKQLLKGLSPRPVLDEDGRPRADVWIAALLQGGGLGIYGDFLFGEYNRAGNKGVIETMAGPAVGEFANVAQLMSRLVRFDKYDDHTLGDVAADSFAALRNNTPFLNTWFLKAAIDHAILFNIQDAISPGYMGRYQKRLHDDQGNGFWWKPAA